MLCQAGAVSTLSLIIAGLATGITAATDAAVISNPVGSA
jgi:hypothetical protein